MQQDVVFEGIVAPLRLTGAEPILPVLRQVAVGWPCRIGSTNRQGRPFFSITGDAGDTPFLCESHIQNTPPRRFDAVNAVCDAIVALALALPAEHPDLICLHAGAVAFAGRLVLFPNVQRAGKSTLSAALAKAGHGLFSDDVVPLSFSPGGGARGHALGIAPRLRLPLPEALGQEFRDWAEQVAGPRNRQYLYLSLPTQPPRGTVLPLGALVILDRQDSLVAATLEPVGPEDAMDALLFQNFSRDRHSGDILEVMAAVLSESPAFRLRYHDLREAVECLKRQFSDWPDPLPVGSDGPRPAFRLADLAPPTAEDAWETGPLAQRQGTTEIRLGNGLFLADAAGRAIHKVDPLGAVIWEMLAEPTTPDELAELLVEAFPGTPRDQIDADLARLLTRMRVAGLTAPAV